MRLFLALLTTIFLSQPAAAQTYPDYTELYVNDFAGLLSFEQAQTIREKLIEIDEKRGVEFTLVTIRSMSQYGHSGEIEPFSTGLFNYWGIGSSDRNDGLMMLVSRDDRKMRLEVGSGYGDSLNLAMRNIIDDVILPEFRAERYGTGIDKGVDAVIREVTGEWPGNIDARPGERAINNIQRFLDWIGAWIWVLLAPVAGLAAWLMRKWQRNRPRICPIDRHKMQRLAEHWDDNHLQIGQITEEQLKSVDYDVWQCPHCEHVTIEGYRNWFSAYGTCRACGFRTVQGDTTILYPATTSSAGQKRIDYQCHHCDEDWSVTKIIPRKTKSSSSSGGGSSFGGGSSSGGGASGSW